MAKHPFLSDEWMDEARKIREEYAGKTLRDHYGLTRPASVFSNAIQAIA